MGAGKERESVDRKSPTKVSELCYTAFGRRPFPDPRRASLSPLPARAHRPRATLSSLFRLAHARAHRTHTTQWRSPPRATRSKATTATAQSNTSTRAPLALSCWLKRWGGTRRSGPSSFWSAATKSRRCERGYECGRAGGVGVWALPLWSRPTRPLLASAGVHVVCVCACVGSRRPPTACAPPQLSTHTHTNPPVRPSFSLPLIHQYVGRELVNHSRLLHPHIVQFREVFLMDKVSCVYV